MIADERIVAYINSLDQGNTPFLNEIESEALHTRVPIIRRETQNFLKLMLDIRQPKQILEVGTATGFSALLMAEYAPQGCRITTIEKYEKRIPIARENICRGNREDVIELIEGDAAEVLRELAAQHAGVYDFIFMDAAKGQYLNFFPDIMKLLSVGGLLISDNVLQDGDIIESRFAVTRRNRTIHSRMREYLYELMNSEKLTTSILPVGDGITVSVKKQD